MPSRSLPLTCRIVSLLTPDEAVMLAFILVSLYHYYHGTYLAAVTTAFAARRWDTLTTHGLNIEGIRLPTRNEFLRGHFLIGSRTADKIECLICCEPYHDIHRRRIKLLCSHVLCADCVGRLPCDDANERRCPFCRRWLGYRVPLPWDRMAVKLWFCGNAVMAVHDALLIVCILGKAKAVGLGEMDFMEILLLGEMARSIGSRVQELEHGERCMDVVGLGDWEAFAGRISWSEMALYVVSLVAAPWSMQRLFSS